jgi:hypothetical protein
MSKAGTRALMIGGIILLAGVCATAARAQDRQTPKGWTYDIRDGKRVPKTDRVTKADGSWREELKQGNCVTVKARSAQGDYKETRQCNPG